jgi:hypothetical protein
VLHSLRYVKHPVYINGCLTLNILNYREKDFRGEATEPGLSAVSAGWHSLSASGKWLFALLVGLLTAAFLFSQWERQQPLMIAFYLCALLIAAGNYLRARVLPQLTARSLLADLSVQDKHICIAGFSFPASVQKLVLGKQSKKGPAFLQLTWNGGQLWLFPLDEISQVEQFIRQHAPHIEIIPD